MGTQLEFLKQLELQEVAPRFDIWLDAVVAHRAAHPEQWQGLRCAETSSLHGRRHWTRVACLGLAMLRDEGERRPPSEQTMLERRFLLSAFFHDIGRLDEGRDTGHADRGERVFRFMAPALSVAPDDVESVAVAIRNHASAPAVLRGADLVAACLANADRLDRARLYEHPTPPPHVPGAAVGQVGGGSVEVGHRRVEGAQERAAAGEPCVLLEIRPLNLVAPPPAKMLSSIFNGSWLRRGRVQGGGQRLRSSIVSREDGVARKRSSTGDTISSIFLIGAVVLVLVGLVTLFWKPLKQSTPGGKLLGLLGLVLVVVAMHCWANPESYLPALSWLLPDGWEKPQSTGHVIVAWTIAIGGIVLYIKGALARATVPPNGAALTASLRTKAPEKVDRMVGMFRKALADGKLDEETELQPLAHEIKSLLSDAGLTSSESAMVQVLAELARQAFDEALEKAKEDGKLTAAERKRLQAYSAVLPNLFPPETIEAALLAADASCAMESGSMPVIKRPGILMRYKGEQCHFVARDVRLAMEQTVSLGYRGGSIGTTVRLGGLPIRLGMHQGKVKTETAVRWVDSGDLFVTSKRIVFVGKARSTTVNLSKVVQVEAEPGENLLAVVTEGAGAKNLFFSTSDAALLAAGVKAISNAQGGE